MAHLKRILSLGLIISAPLAALAFALVLLSTPPESVFGAELAEPASTNTAALSQPLNMTQAASDDGSQVTLMVLYTPAARDAAGGVAAIEGEIATVVDSMNEAAVNSLLTFTFELVHTAELSASESITYSGGFINQLWQEQTNYPEVHEWRDRYAADLVVVWGDSQPSSNAGVAFQLTEYDIDSSRFAYAHVRRTAALNSYTMHHEVGHLMGAGHGINASVVISKRLYADAFGYGDEAGGFYTIMGADVSPTMTTPINYFSNPNVLYNGVATGTPYSSTTGYGENNAYVLNQTALLVSNYRLTPSSDTTLEVDTITDDWTLTGCEDGVPNDCSLRGAIRVANASITTSITTISLQPNATYLLTETSALYEDDDYGAYGDLDMRGDITIEGHGAAVSGDNIYRVFHIHEADDLIQFEDLAIEGGFSSESGGGIRIDAGHLVLENCEVRGNVSQKTGGGIYSVGDGLDLSFSVVEGNSAGNKGGGIGGAPESVSLDFSEVISNQAVYQGGGIFFQGETVSINYSTVAYNEVTGSGSTTSGGGVFSSGFTELYDSDIHHNTAGLAGGGIYQQNTDAGLDISDSQIYQNEARQWGGGVYSFSPVLIQTSAIVENRAGSFGGGITIDNGDLELENSTVSSNIVTNNIAGGIWLKNSAFVYIVDSTLVSNTHSALYSKNADEAEVEIESTILAYHTKNCVGPLMAVSSADYNLSSDATCTLAEANDQINTDPLLGALADNGGEALSHALLMGSPAIDQIPAEDCNSAEDQRGLPRPFGTHCDIGAVERGAATPKVSTAFIPLSQAELSWSENTINQSYEIFREATPYSGSSTSQGVTASNIFTQELNAGQNAYYTVIATGVDGSAATSTEQGLFHFSLTPGE